MNVENMDIEEIRTMVSECKAELFDAMGGPEDQELMQKMYINLDEMEDHFRSVQISDKIEAMEATRDQLVDVANEIKEKIEDLEQISNVVSKAEKVVKIVVKAAKLIV